MNRELQQELKQRLATLNGRERKELSRHASERRAQAQRMNSGPESRWSVELFMLHELRRREPLTVSALVVAATGTRCRVLVDGQLREMRLHHSLRNIVPGDEVDPGVDPIREVLPRRTYLSRPDPYNAHEQLAIVANVELAAIVVSCVSPPLHPRLIDRYLAVLWRGGIEPLVVLNKVDLHESKEALAADRRLLECYREMGLAVFEVSAARPESLAGLAGALAGRLSVFVGHSGVGKSSLVNALAPEARAATGSISAGNERGAHTTRTSTLIQSGELRIIDTPGVRAFGVAFRSVAEVAECFREFPRGCRFSDCTHVHEQGCAVRRAVAQGEVSRQRYDSYRRLIADL